MLLGKCAQAPSGAVAGHGIAQFLGGSEAIACERGFFLCLLQHKSRRNKADTTTGNAQKVTTGKKTILFWMFGLVQLNN